MCNSYLRWCLVCWWLGGGFDGEVEGVDVGLIELLVLEVGLGVGNCGWGCGGCRW